MATVTVDRDLVEQFIIEVDALAAFEMYRSGGDTPLVEHIYRIITPFEEATLGELSESEAERLHDRAHDRGAEVFRTMYQPVFDREAVAS